VPRSFGEGERCLIVRLLVRRFAAAIVAERCLIVRLLVRRFAAAIVAERCLIVRLLVRRFAAAIVAERPCTRPGRVLRMQLALATGEC
jgi:hypothetical protein